MALHDADGKAASADRTFAVGLPRSNRRERACAHGRLSATQGPRARRTGSGSMCSPQCSCVTVQAGMAAPVREHRRAPRFGRAAEM